MLRQLVYIYLMSLPPEFVYQGVLLQPDNSLPGSLCHFQIYLRATNSLFAASFQLLLASFLFELHLHRGALCPCLCCGLSPAGSAALITSFVSSGFVSFVCYPMDLWQFALLHFQSLLLSSLANPERGILFKRGISALKLKLCKDLGNWISGTRNYWMCSLLYGSGPIMCYYFPAFAFLWAVVACSLECL